MEEVEDVGLVYSKELRLAIKRIGELSAEIQPPTYFSQYNDIIPALYCHLLDYDISWNTYRLVWQMLNRIVVAGNFVWFKQYWASAVQYELFKFKGDKRLEPYKRFYFFNVMVGALLCFNKKYEWLTYILFFTTQLPERYGLVPNTFQEILDVAETIYLKNEHPFYFESNFEFEGLASGARDDSIIIGAAYDYLSLLMVRLWSLDYNVSYVEPKDLPSLDSVNIDRNEVLRRVAGILMKKVERWYANDRIDEVELRVKPLKADVLQLLENFSQKAEQVNDEIFERAEPDLTKIEKLRGELQESALRHSEYFPKSTDSELDAKVSEYHDYRLDIKYKVEKSLLIAGMSLSYTNLPDVLVKSLVYQAIGFYEKIFIGAHEVLSYKIKYDDIATAIGKLSLTENHVIISFGEYIDDRVRTDAPIVNIESRMGCIFVIRKDQLPYVEYVTKKIVEPDMEDVGPIGVHLYSNINHLAKDYSLKIAQYIRMFSPKKPIKTIRINVNHFSLRDDFDIDNIVPVKL